MEDMAGKDKLSKLPEEAQHELMKKWEQNIKTQFDTDTSEISITIPHELAKAIRNPLKLFKKGNGREQINRDTMRFSS